jgi:carbonic anhydrase
MRTIAEAIERLKLGNKRFVNDTLKNSKKDSDRRSAIIKGQDPFAIILGCADSRVVPEHIFDSGLGELFVVGVAGNIANTSSIASIEYAVAHLGTPLIVVLGHQNCGAVTAAVKGGDNGYNLNHLLAHITPAIYACSADADINDIAKKNAELTVKDLNDRSAIISKAVASGKLQIIAAYYQLETGLVEFLD